MFDGLRKKVIIWRSRYNQSPIKGTKHIIYYEDLFLMSLIFYMLGFVALIFLLWQINVTGFVRPPNPIFIGSMPDFAGATGNPIMHIQAWFKILLHEPTVAVFKRLHAAVSFIPVWKPFNEEILAYRHMGTWLDHNGLMPALINRVRIALGGAVPIGMYGAYMVINNPVPSEDITEKRGMRVLYGLQAQAEFFKQTAEELKHFGKFALVAASIWWSSYRVITHTIGIGASGSGKSQFLEVHIKASMDQGLKTVILDPKYEFTQALYNPDDPSHAILDPTDSRSHVWDLAGDINTISKIRRFASSFIPSSEGEDAMWGNLARQLFVGSQLYLQKEFPDFTPKDITNIFSMFNSDMYYYIMKNYYPQGIDAVGTLDEDGKVEENVTNYGVKANLKGYIDGLMDLGRYWNNPNQKKISLYEFMTNPDYPIRTIFIKPNDEERLMSSGIIRAMLNFMISLLDSPQITNTKKLRGIFFLDEFHAPGKLTMEDGSPTINKLLDRGRSKGWGSYIFVQDIMQIYNTYSEQIYKQWRAVASQFILCGTPPGETAQTVCDIIGKEYFDKANAPYEFDPNTGKMKRGALTIQEHEAPVILPGELSGYLKPTNGHIRYLVLARGLLDAFILEKPIVPLDELQPAWVAQPEDTTLVDLTSRVLLRIQGQMNPDEQKEELKPVAPATPVVTIPDDELGATGNEYDEPGFSLNDDDEEEIVFPDEDEIDLEDWIDVDERKNIYLLAVEAAEVVSLNEKEKTILLNLVSGQESELSIFIVQPIVDRLSENKHFVPLIDYLKLFI